MSDEFTRTPTGIVGKWMFYSVPTIWVEGPTDIYFYSPVVEDLNCRIEAFHGCHNARALIEGLISDNFPYLVVLDGDYEILSKRRTPHRRVIRLQRYSCENYLWESDPVNRVCHCCAQSGDRNDIVGAEFSRVNQHLSETLREMVEVDVAARRTHPTPQVMPAHVERLLVNEREPVICPSKVGDITKAALPAIDEQTLKTAQSEVSSYLEGRRFADLLKGHILFGILRLVCRRTVLEIRRSKFNINDENLMQLLADATWKIPPSKDHKVLRAKIRKMIRELVPLCIQAK